MFNDQIFEAGESSSTCRRNVEAAPANRDSGAVPANTRRKKVQSRGSSSRYTNVEIADSEEVLARKRKRGRPKGSVGRKKKGMELITA